MTERYVERQNNNKYKEDRDVFDNQSVFGSLVIAYCLFIWLYWQEPESKVSAQGRTWR